ncbi:MAG: AMP-binding enzyme, partial [Beijerinckiaceae bacterium]
FPSRLDIPVLDARPLSPGRLREALLPGDLIVATPHLWRYLATSLPRFPAGVSGATSTAPMPADLAGLLLEQKLERLTEIYGSSETAGIAWRDNPASAFRLFDGWAVADDGEVIYRIEADGTLGEPVPFADHVIFEGERLIRPVGRRDGAVQVGGINVFPDRVRRRIEACEGVAAAVVRAFAVGGDAARQRLKAFVVPGDRTADTAALEAAIRASLGGELAEVERPAAYRFGPALPVNAIGKAMDWD